MTAKILLVDDEPRNLMALEAALGDLRLSPVKASSGREALRHAMAEDFAVILLDVHLPGMDGFEIARLLREGERSRHTPIVFMTAVWRSEEDRSQGYESGAVDYLIKPIEPRILRHKVKILVDHYERDREVKRLNGHLRDHARALEEAIKSLRLLNTGLEARVLARTQELEANGVLLARSNRDLAQFASVVSHDLQEPLRTVGNHLVLLERAAGPVLGAEARQHLDQARETASRMRRLISGLLDFFRLGPEMDAVSDVDVNATVREVLEKLNGAIIETQAIIDVDLLPNVLARPSLLAQLFQNLVENALKFYEAGPPHVELGADARGSETLYWVRDHGIGIAAADIDKLFRPMRRLDPRFPGTGMGLAWCKKIVELHGGRLWVESKLGRGSTFYFSLSRSGS